MSSAAPAERSPLSVLLLARDESRRLARLLPTLGFAREVVVVVDSATRDDTREVAARHGARVLERALDGFGAQRRFALEHCREPWVLWIDADERLDPVAERAVREAVDGEGGPAGYYLERRTWFLDHPVRWCGWHGERCLRLFRREAARFDDAQVHERVEVEGVLRDLPGVIQHHSYESWAEARDKLVRYAAAGAAQARRSGRRAGPLDLLWRPPLRFLRMYVLQLGFLDGAHGVAVCALAAAQVLLKYAELWAGPATPVAGADDPPATGRGVDDPPAAETGAGGA